MSSESKAMAFRTGWIVFALLAVLTIVEYFVSISLNSTVLLFIIMLIKTALIVNYFMHVYRLWREENH
jgi:cytochrome c oxidase subunit IV